MSRTVGDVMTSEFIYVRTDTKLTRVLQLMVDHRIRSVPVIDDERRLAGIIAREGCSQGAGRLRAVDDLPENPSHTAKFSASEFRPADDSGRQDQFSCFPRTEIGWFTQRG